MSKTMNKFSPEVRERVVRLVIENEGQHSSRWQAIMSISAKIGCSGHTLSEWVKKAEVDSSKRAELAGRQRRFYNPFRRHSSFGFQSPFTFKLRVHEVR